MRAWGTAGVSFRNSSTSSSQTLLSIPITDIHFAFLGGVFCFKSLKWWEKVCLPTPPQHTLLLYTHKHCCIYPTFWPLFPICLPWPCPATALLALSLGRFSGLCVCLAACRLPMPLPAQRSLWLSWPMNGLCPWPGEWRFSPGGPSAAFSLSLLTLSLTHPCNPLPLPEHPHYSWGKLGLSPPTPVD